MSNDSYELTPDPEPLLPEIREILDAMFGMSEHVYDLLVECIPDIEASDYVLGIEFEEALTLSSNRVCEAKEELEPYFALLSLAFASRSFRNTFSPDSFDDQADNPEGRWFDITPATDLVLDRVEEIEGLDVRSERQTTVLQICYLILTEGELGRGNPMGLASEYFSAACAFPPINHFARSDHKLDQEIRGLCLFWCWAVEYISQKHYQTDHFWDLTDREVLQFYSGLLRMRVVPHQHLPLTNLFNIVSKESVELKSLLPASLGTADEPGSWQPFNTSFKELLEAVDEFRKQASDDDVNDGDNPSESALTTSAFWCWQFGQLVGMVAKDLDSDQLGNIMSDRSWFSGIDSPHKESNWHVFSLFVECDGARDWPKFQALAKQAWFSLVQDEYSGLGEISPTTRSYWAMRVGLCDAYLDSVQVMRYSDVSTSAPPEIGAQAQEFIRELADQVAAKIDNTRNEERAHLENLIKSRFPPSNSELRDFVDERLGHVLSKYPSTAIRSALIRAERYYLTHTDIDDSKLWFSKSVEGIFEAAFVDGLMDFIKETEKPVEIIFASKRGAEMFSKKKIKELSLGEWGDAFRALSSTAPVGTLARGSILNQYLSSCFGNVDLNELASDLGQVQKYRNSAGHFHKDGRPDEVKNVDEFRRFVLRIECNSVIKKITDMLRPGNTSDLNH